MRMHQSHVGIHCRVIKNSVKLIFMIYFLKPGNTLCGVNCAGIIFTLLDLYVTGRLRDNTKTYLLFLEWSSRPARPLRNAIKKNGSK